MVLTRVAVALVELDITDGAGVSRIALTGVGGNTILTHTVVAWIWLAVVDVLLTEQTSEAWVEGNFLLCELTFSDYFLGQKHVAVSVYLQHIHNRIR